MTVPAEVLAFARDLESMMQRAAEHAATLTAMSDQASGPEALGYAALAGELYELSKVQRNYVPRLMKHVGETFVESERKEWETSEEARERLDLEFEALMNKSRLTELSAEEDARYSALSSGLGRPITV